MTTTYKHRATEPLPVQERADVSGGAHRASRTTETVVTLTLGTILIVLACYLALRA